MSIKTTTNRNHSAIIGFLRRHYAGRLEAFLKRKGYQQAAFW